MKTKPLIIASSDVTDEGEERKQLKHEPQYCCHTCDRPGHDVAVTAADAICGIVHSAKLCSAHHWFCSQMFLR